MLAKGRAGARDRGKDSAEIAAKVRVARGTGGGAAGDGNAVRKAATDRTATAKTMAASTTSN